MSTRSAPRRASGIVPEAPPSVARRLRHLLLDVVTNAFGRNLQYLVALATVPVVAHRLSPGGFALYALSTAAYFFGSAIVDAGLSTALAGRIAQVGAERTLALRRQYINLRLVLFMVILSSGAIIMAAPGWLYVWLGLCAGGISSLGEEWLFVARGQFIAVVLMQWAGRLTYFGALVIAMPLLPRAWVPMICLALGGCVTSSLAWLKAGKPGAARTSPQSSADLTTFAGPELNSAARLLLFGWPSMVARILASSYTQSSPLLISIKMTGGSLGLFAASDRLMRAVQAVVDSLTLSLIPRMARSWARGNVTMRTVAVLVAASFGFGAVAGVGLAGLAPIAVRVLYGRAYEGVLPVIRLACLILPLTCTTGMLTTNVLMVGQRPRAVLLVHVVGLGAALSYVLLLGSHSSARAAVFCILVAEAAALVVTLILSRRLIANGPAGFTAVSC